MASFIKINNQWVPVSEVYKKVNGFDEAFEVAFPAQFLPVAGGVVMR